MKKCVVIYNPHSGKKTKKDFQNEFIKILVKKMTINQKLYILSIVAISLK